MRKVIKNFLRSMEAWNFSNDSKHVSSKNQNERYYPELDADDTSAEGLPPCPNLSLLSSEASLGTSNESESSNTTYNERDKFTNDINACCDAQSPETASDHRSDKTFNHFSEASTIVNDTIQHQQSSNSHLNCSSRMPEARSQEGEYSSDATDGDRVFEQLSIKLRCTDSPGTIENLLSPKAARDELKLLKTRLAKFAKEKLTLIDKAKQESDVDKAQRIKLEALLYCLRISKVAPKRSIESLRRAVSAYNKANVARLAPRLCQILPHASPLVPDALSAAKTLRQVDATVLARLLVYEFLSCDDLAAKLRPTAVRRVGLLLETAVARRAALWRICEREVLSRPLRSVFLSAATFGVWPARKGLRVAREWWEGSMKDREMTAEAICAMRGE